MPIQMSARGEEINNFEFSFVYPDGSQRQMLGNATPLLDENGKPRGSVSSFIDITERKLSDEKLKKTMDELSRSNQELEHFAHVASHDLREPLRMITSFLQLLEKRYKDQLDQNANEFIGFAVDGAKRLNNMIKDLLEYSQVMKKEREFNPVKLDKVLEETLINLVVQTEENNVTITYDPLPNIMGDEKLLVYLFQNLIGNAIKYRSQETPQIHISAIKQKDHFLLSVKDNGIGIDSEHLNRIFTIFQRLHGNEEYEGTGIGLAIAQKIVHLHGGRIWAESELGKGSTFYFTIPKIEY
jgi:light-regulated signal transduction histidine kinase (bacteriophytochrome)